MPKDTFNTAGGKLESGKRYKLTLSKGSREPRVERLHLPEGEQGDYSEATLTGTVRVFDHVERVYDEEGIATGKKSEVRYELVTDNGQWSAVGFLPENVVKSESA